MIVIVLLLLMLAIKTSSLPRAASRLPVVVRRNRLSAGSNTAGGTPPSPPTKARSPRFVHTSQTDKALKEYMASRQELGGSETRHLKSFHAIEGMSYSAAAARWKNYLKEAAVSPIESAGDASSVAPPEVLLLLQFDGGSRGNPGPGGSGSVAFQLLPPAPASPPSYSLNDTPYRKRELWRSYSYLGDSVTNNVAEYTGLLGCMTHLKAILRQVEGASVRVRIEGDSQLVIRQLTGEYKVKNAPLREIYDKVMSDVSSMSRRPSPAVRFEYSHVPRALNSEADALSNEAMDLRCSRSSQTASVLLE